MEYEKDNVILDFARRTRANLEHLELAKQRGEKVFEVTQLANSLLGLLVFPKEHYVRSIPRTPLIDLVDQGWPRVRTTQGALPQEDLRSLITMLRNSIAHCNVEFLSDPTGEMVGIRLWNRRGGEITWEAELDLVELRSIALKFVELLERDHGARSARVADSAVAASSGRCLENLREELARFAAERDWDQFHNPKNLAMALSVEVAELVEHFQWLTVEQSQELEPEVAEKVRAEIGDVLIYLLRLGDKLGVDLLLAASDKLIENERKYPADKVRGKSKKYDQY